MKNKKFPISLVMVIRNEDVLLERALKSCSDIVDDIVIVHDGECQDNSVMIAKQYTKKVYTLPAQDSAQPHRPFTYKKAKNNWILQLDADEYLSQDLRTQLPDLIKRDTDIYIVPWPTLSQGRYYPLQYKTVLFKKDKVYYIGATHEYPKPISKNVIVKKINMPLIHEPDYEDISLKIFKSKWVRRAKVHASLLKKDFDDIPKWNYDRGVWDFPTNLRVRSPMLIGMLLTPMYHIMYSFLDFIKHRSVYSLKHGLSNSGYFFLVFYYFKFK